MKVTHLTGSKHKPFVSALKTNQLMYHLFQLVTHQMVKPSQNIYIIDMSIEAAAGRGSE